MTKEPDDAAVRENLGVDEGARWRQVAQRHFDPDEGEELTTALVFAIAEARAVDPVDLRPPLYQCVDAAALEASLFGSDVGGRRQSVGTVAFRYGEYLVTIAADGWITVEEQTTPGPP